MKREQQDGGKPQEDRDANRRDRRSRERVDDKQRSGQGSATALSRLKMLERRYQLPLESESPEKNR